MSERRVIRLSVNLAPTVADALKSVCTAKHITITEGIRQAIALWKLVSDARALGERVFVIDAEHRLFITDAEITECREVIWTGEVRS